MMADSPPPPPTQHQPQYEQEPSQQDEQEMLEARMEYSSDYEMRNSRLEPGLQEHPNVVNPQTSTFTTAGFTTYNYQIPPQSSQNSLPMEGIHKMLQELYKAVTEKVVMENAAMFTALKAESLSVKKELEDLRKEVRSTYLSKNIPCGIDKEQRGLQSGLSSTPINTPIPEPQNSVNSLPRKPVDLLTPHHKTIAPTMASVAAKNVTKTNKPEEWTTVPGKGSKKGLKNSSIFPDPVKTAEESKRRVIFRRKAGASTPPSNIAQDILHAVNMKLLSMKVPAHLRLARLRYNDRGNLTGLTTAQTTADLMIPRFKELCLQIALRFDPDITEISANQQWVHLKAHAVDLERYYKPSGLDQIKEEVYAGPSAVELPLTPRWIAGQKRMDYIVLAGTKRHSSIYFTVKTDTEADRLLKQGLHFGGKYHKVERYRRVGPDTLCPTCCHWGHTTYECPTPDKVKCAICAGPHLTVEHVCPIEGCKSEKGKNCSKHGSYKCANCGGKHMANSISCPDYRQAINIARHSRDEWREQEKSHELRQSCPETEADLESVCSFEVEENKGERIEEDIDGTVDLEMEVEVDETTQGKTFKDNGGKDTHSDL